MKNRLKVLALLAALAFATATLAMLFDFTVNQTTPVSRFDPGSSGKEKPFPIARTIWSALVMIVGIVAGALNSNLRGRQQIESVIGELMTTLRSTQFIKSVVAAPIVFSAVYLATRTQPDWVLASIFAFENGFFCDSLLRTHQPQGQK